ncbi:kinase-like domain-containing protein [Dimargaris cristalligena]|uniref:Kinase-like domain-containing protein n=1 Tax=Dimargaris cristalligena TaxID=215637 RepID=A0A4Q0A129_9FUNG|nr:kinase-like domain-containing protein [Dimargaris cristalligena]|eukprot:RKP39727.1 kinase-like domain-containing protein [Dimargaris cristalligena]
MKKTPQPPTYYRKKEYTFGKILGNGTFGEVYECVRRKDKVHVAIKVIRKSLLNGDPTMVNKEINVMRNLHNENIVELYDYFESNDNYYLVFSLATGGELFERISQQGRFSEQDAVSVMRTVFTAVKFLHDHQVVHRDLKPENLLYKDTSADSPLVIADFGIAKTMRGDDDVLTTVCGSYGYVAPEIIRRKGYGKPVDMWSLGIITFTILCGYSPYYFCENAQEMLVVMERHEVNFDKRYWWGISEGAKEFIRALLHPDPQQRLTADQALHHHWLEGHTALDNDLLPDVIEQSKARRTFQRAVHKLRLVNRLRKLSSSSSDPENNDEATHHNEDTIQKPADPSDTNLAARSAAAAANRKSADSSLSHDSFVSAKSEVTP